MVDGLASVDNVESLVSQSPCVVIFPSDAEAVVSVMPHIICAAWHPSEDQSVQEV